MKDLALYEVAGNALALLSQVDEDGCFPEGTEEALALLDKKCTSTAAYILNQEAAEDALYAALQRLKTRHAAAKNRNGNLRKYLESNMVRTGINEITCDYFQITLDKGKDGRGRDKSLIVTDIGKIPQQFVKEKIEHVIDKAEVKAAIESGMEIEGAYIQSKNRLTIR